MRKITWDECIFHSVINFTSFKQSYKKLIYFEYKSLVDSSYICKCYWFWLSVTTSSFTCHTFQNSAKTNSALLNNYPFDQVVYILEDLLTKKLITKIFIFASNTSRFEKNFEESYKIKEIIKRHRSTNFEEHNQYNGLHKPKKIVVILTISPCYKRS